jgi:hypothetical protein
MGEHANVRAKLMPQFDDIDVPQHDAYPTSNNPAAATYGIHAPTGWVSQPIVLHFGSDVPEDLRSGVLKAASIWNEAVGFTLITFGADHSEADDICDLYSRLDDKVSTISVVNDWKCTGKPSFVLGTTIWDNDDMDFNKIETADIVFNSDYYVIGDAEVAETDGYREVVDAESLALHELGHLLGLAHIPSTFDAESVMSANVFIGEGIFNRRISQGDIERIQRIYRLSNEPEHAPGGASESGD